jgi:transcription elongation factor Elf1
MSKREQYPDRSKYFNFKKSDRVRYFKFKTRCPRCSKVCIEDFLSDKDEKTKRATLNCHRCGHDTRDDSEPFLIWKRVVQ